MTYAKAYLPPIMNSSAENMGHKDMGPRPGLDPHSSSAGRSHCQVKLSGKGREMHSKTAGLLPMGLSPNCAAKFFCIIGLKQA